MKEELYTIPVNEALDQDGECLFCTLNRKLESDILDYILGPSYMEEDIRGETDKYGFCKKHYTQMFSAQNRLGVALMLSTHLKYIRENLEKHLDEDIHQSGGRKSIFKKNENELKSPIYLTEIENSCYACRRMDARMKSYIDTFFHLWKREPEFIDKIKNSKGFCLKHFNMLINTGQEKLDPKRFNEFLKIIVSLELSNLNTLQEDIDWFIQKFDYRFQDEPWKNSKDAVSRAILKISSEYVEE